MSTASYARWVQDRAASDEEIEDLVASHMQSLFEACSNENAEEETRQLRHGGSRIGRAPNLLRNHEDGHLRIVRDYFGEHPTYPPNLFRRRFRMQRSLFSRIHDSLVDDNPYFVQKPDAVGNAGLSSLQKVVAALRMFTLGIAADSVDEYVRIGESTAMKAFKAFAHGVVQIFGPQYLRPPTREDVLRHLQFNANRGFPGMFGSLDCTHWSWKNCPVSARPIMT